MRILPALILVATTLTLVAETTGRLNGKVTNKAGMPVPTAKVILKRLDIVQNRELRINSDGTFLQVGLLPKDYELTASAEGYAPFSESVKIGMDTLLTKNIVLLTAEEARKESVATGKAVVVEDPGASLENVGADAYNGAVELYNAKKYAEALPLIELAYTNLKESAEKTVDAAAKATVVEKLGTVERTYAITMFEVGSASESKQALIEKAKPLLEKAFTANPKDTRSLDALLKIAKVQKDKVAEKKYEGMVDAILGPRPEIAYNEGVNAFNAGNVKEAREHLLKAIQIKADYPDSYYLLAMVEFSSSNLKGTKAHLLKYLELAPNGKDAATAREMLKDPSLKNIK